MQEEAFNRRECRPFFAGLLPEEIQRKLIAQSFGVSERNDFSLLDKIGGECAGAVSLMPPGQRPDASRWTSQPLTREELALKLDRTAQKAPPCRRPGTEAVARGCPKQNGSHPHGGAVWDSFDEPEHRITTNEICCGPGY